MVKCCHALDLCLNTADLPLSSSREIRWFQLSLMLSCIAIDTASLVSSLLLLHVFGQVNWFVVPQYARSRRRPAYEAKIQQEQGNCLYVDSATNCGVVDSGGIMKEPGLRELSVLTCAVYVSTVHCSPVSETLIHQQTSNTLFVIWRHLTIIVVAATGHQFSSPAVSSLNKFVHCLHPLHAAVVISLHH